MPILQKLLNALLGHNKEDNEELHVPAGLRMSQLALSQAGLLGDHHKTERQKQMIMNILFSHTAFSELTNEQRVRLVDFFLPVEVSRGSLLFRQGDFGHYFYVIEEGECEVYAQLLDPPTYRVATLHKGASFGELALMYNGDRRATVLATQDTKLWVLDRNTFEGVMSSRTKELQTLFDKYAVRMGSPTAPQSFLTLDGFISAFSHHRETASPTPAAIEAKKRLRVLFKMIDRENLGIISFADFVLFAHIMANPDPEFQIAFRHFDRFSNGQVSKQDFMDTLIHNSSSIADEAPGEGGNSFLKFDCDLINRFFGPTGHERPLGYLEFAEFFIRYQIEYAHQLFQRLDVEHEGWITKNEFMTIVPRMGDVRAPTYAPYFLKSLADKEQHVSFAEFVAFQNFLHHLPAIERVLKGTFNQFPNTVLNKSVFRALVRANAVTTVSPLEAEICFRVFGTAQYTIIINSSFRRHSVNWPLSDQITEKDDGTIEIDEKLLGIDLTNLNGHQTEAWLYLFVAQSKEMFTNLFLGAVTIKTRMQFSRSNPVIPGRYVYKSSWDCFRHIIERQGGVRGLYRGCLPPILGVLPEKLTKIFVNDQLRGLFGSHSRGELYLPLEVLAGAGAGACQVIFTNPIEILKIRAQLQVEPMPYKYGRPPVLDPPKGTISLASDLGLTGLYRGTGACLLRDIIFSAIYFPAYASFKHVLSDPISGEVSPLGLLLAGGTAAVPAAFLTTPLDVIKTRLQAKAITTGDWEVNSRLKFRSIADCALKTFRHEGLRAFWKGAGMRVLLWAPQFSISLFMYEVLHRNFFPQLLPMPLTSVPVSSNVLTAFRTKRVTEKLKLMENQRRTVHPTELDNDNTK